MSSEAYPADVRMDVPGQVEGGELQQCVGLEVPGDDRGQEPRLVMHRSHRGDCPRKEDTVASDVVDVAALDLRQELDHGRQQGGRLVLCDAVLHQHAYGGGIGVEFGGEGVQMLVEAGGLEVARHHERLVPRRRKPPRRRCGSARWTRG